MTRPSTLVFACFLAAACCVPPARAASPYRVPVHFAYTNDATGGYSYFVVGSHPDLGEWDVLRAVPLAWHTGNVWSADIGIQAGAHVEYKFVRRHTGADQIANPDNKDWWYPEGPNLVLDVPAEPPAPNPGKRVVFLCDWPAPVKCWYSTLSAPDYEATTDWYGVEMVKTGDARYELDGIGEAGEWIRFSFEQPDKGWAYRFYGTDQDFWTPLDGICVRDGQVFSYEPEAPLSTPVSDSRIEKVVVHSTADQVDEREIRIYLPRGYDQNASRRYPVMYFADGQNIFASDHSSDVAWGVDTAADEEIRGGRMRETILVGVPCRETPPPGCPDLLAFAGRLWEYLPGDDLLKDPTGQVNLAIPGNGYNYMKFLLDNVRPTLDWNYRTLTDRANTGHAGSSAGGLLSFWMGTYTNVFGLIGAVSGVYNQDYIPNFRKWCEGNFASIAAPRRIWLDTGNGETNILGLNLYDSNWDALMLLLYAGHVQNKSLHFGVYHNTWDEYGNSDHLGDHHEIAWADRTPEILKFLLPVTDDTNPLLLRPPEISLDGLTMQIPAYPGFTYTAKRVGSVMDLRKGASATTVCSTNIVDRPWGVITCTATNAGFYWVEGR